MKYRILKTGKGSVVEDLSCNDKYEAWCCFTWQLPYLEGSESIMLFANNVIIKKAGVCSKPEKNMLLKYLNLNKPSLLKKLVVKIYYFIVYLF